MKKSVVASIIVVLVVAFALVAVILANPLQKEHSATVTLTVTNYQIANRTIEIYANGHFVLQKTIIYIESFTFNVTWKGNSTNECLIEVFSEGDRATATVWLTDGMTDAKASVYFTSS